MGPRDPGAEWHDVQSNRPRAWQISEPAASPLPALSGRSIGGVWIAGVVQDDINTAEPGDNGGDTGGDRGVDAGAIRDVEPRHEDVLQPGKRPTGLGGADRLLPMITGFMADDPDVRVDLVTEGRVIDIIAEGNRIDVVVQNAGHMMFGPAEAFTPGQFAQQYDVNVLGTRRVNRAVLPHMRARREGLLVAVSSSSSAGGTPSYLSPYFAAKAAMDSLAVQYSRARRRQVRRHGVRPVAVPGPL
jgi:NAD(P)-dependent dehydrogenase (short-subunit alcohol dehydrogenase family)